MPDATSLVPKITDEDIKWVCALMKLDDLDAPRRAFLASRATLDVSACPGSGKTTLVVAKLAILAQKWSQRTRGICVLSHTNVAREEIECRLGQTVVGQHLLSYPHFIDTIHGFVNRFLALPWLRSNGFPPPTVDNDVTTVYRRSVLTKADYFAVQSFLEKKWSSFDRLRICDRHLNFDLQGKAFPAKEGTKTFSLAKEAVETAARAGYFCHDEMFVWARALLEDFPAINSWLRRRFPLVIIDEMQDTMEAQGAMLHAVFPRNSPDIVVQRVGDPNQALFDDFDVSPNKKEPFPDPDLCLTIPNSYRFGPEIAAIASPFAVTPVGTFGLCGRGPKAVSVTRVQCPHAIFIFPDHSTEGVLDSYGRHILHNCHDHALARGIVAAVGAVHHDAPEIAPGHPHFPKSVPHYWSGYLAEISRKESHPKTFVQYLRSAQAAAQESGDLSPGVEKIALGLLRLADLVGDLGPIKRKIRTHRTVFDALVQDTEAARVYRRLLNAILVHCRPVTEASWGMLREDFLGVACSLCDGDTDHARVGTFLNWPADLALETCSSGSPSNTRQNVYRVTYSGRHLDIQLGSIHSVKGQTHLATLILNTFWNAHSSRRILPWLLGTKVNECGAGVQDRRRLIQTYVAMTRPSHLICLAAPRSVFGDEKAFSEQSAILKSRGWSVAEIIDGSSQWHS